jgi:hypothetical protein
MKRRREVQVQDKDKEGTGVGGGSRDGCRRKRMSIRFTHPQL